jgi:hypothetical protein
LAGLFYDYISAISILTKNSFLWLTGKNWVGDAVPGTTALVQFKGTSSKDVIIDDFRI